MLLIMAVCMGLICDQLYVINNGCWYGVNMFVGVGFADDTKHKVLNDSNIAATHTNKEGTARNQKRRPSSPTSRNRSESITKLQKLQQRITIPRLAGLVSWMGGQRVG